MGNVIKIVTLVETGSLLYGIKISQTVPRTLSFAWNVQSINPNRGTGGLVWFVAHDPILMVANQHYLSVAEQLS